MTLYYREPDGVLIDLSDKQYGALNATKRAALHVYAVDAEPLVSARQLLVPGPVVLKAGAATRTWTLVEKSAETLAAEKFTAEREADLALARQAFQALKSGTGTNVERIARCERVLARLLKDLFGGEPS